MFCPHCGIDTNQNDLHKVVLALLEKGLSPNTASLVIDKRLTKQAIYKIWRDDQRRLEELEKARASGTLPAGSGKPAESIEKGQLAP